MTYLPKEPFVRPLGRVAQKNDALYLTYGCSGLEFVFEGTRAEVTIATNYPEKPEGEYGFASYLGVFVDGVETKRISPREASASYVLCENEAPHKTTVRLCKLSEEHISDIVITGITADGIPTATPPHARRIELIGDSLTCGFGVEHPKDGPGGFLTEYENADAAWGGTLGRLLDADISICARSGAGVISCYSDGENISTWGLMKDLYSILSPHWCCALDNSLVRDDSFAPQAVVINLGTNDASWTRGIPEREQQFGTAYFAFLQQVRKHNPQAHIFCTIGPCNMTLWDQIQQQAARFAQEIDPNCSSFLLNVAREGDGSSPSCHPTLPQQKRMAFYAAAAIREGMGW